MSDLESVYRDAITTRLMRRMSHALQHDLKSPIQGIQWALELALKSVAAEGTDPKARAQVEKAVDMARKELARLDKTSRAFLNDSGITDDTEQRFDLGEVVRETVRHFVTDAAMRNVRLTVDVPAVPVHVRGFRGGVSQAVLTCVLHALDSAPDGGLADVALKVEGEEAVIEIGDDALVPAGVDDPFGLGVLGIRLAQTFIESHGGVMRVTPRANGKRRRMCMAVPLDREPA
ncbi:hypothetical protein BWI17_00795 [Betaproteobacteria bacterium GR16-43]|nr:hypothetical protein BWI17_00795 [Betaproteobacteria bacterium GR16-43]